VNNDKITPPKWLADMTKLVNIAIARAHRQLSFDQGRAII
jgi:hypothetical protein